MNCERLLMDVRKLILWTHRIPWTLETDPSWLFTQNIHCQRAKPVQPAIRYDAERSPMQSSENCEFVSTKISKKMPTQLGIKHNKTL